MLGNSTGHLKKEYEMPKYRLEKVEHLPGKSRENIYKSILEEFLGTDIKTAQVNVEDRKPISVYQGLIKAKKETKSPVQIRQRS